MNPAPPGLSTKDKDRILIALSESERTSFGKADFFQQPLPQKVFSAVWAVESEVNNGGFAQYFQNSSVETAWFVVDALNRIGAPQTAAICQRAIAAAFPDGIPEDPEAAASAVSQMPPTTADELDRLDAEFMAYPHSLTDLLFAFVVAHPEEFGAVTGPA